MADPTINAVGTTVSNTSTSAVTLTVPSVTGSLALLVFRTRFTHANSAPLGWRVPTAPAGFTQIISVQRGNIGASLTTRLAVHAFWAVNPGTSVGLDVSAATGGDLTRETAFMVGIDNATGIDTDTPTQDGSTWPGSAQNIAVTKIDSLIFAVAAAVGTTKPTFNTANGFSVLTDSTDTPAFALATKAGDVGTIALPVWDGAGDIRVQVGFTFVSDPPPAAGGRRGLGLIRG